VQAPDRAGAGDDDRADDALGLALAGPRYGQAVHAVFEHADFAAWQKPIARLPERETELVRRELARQGLLGTADVEAAVARVAADVRATLARELPCGIALGHVIPERRRAEMSFHLGLGAARLSDLYSTLHAHGYQRDRSAASNARLRGLLTGVIDLVFEHDGRYYVVDYKTNRLPRYDDAALARAIVDSAYDLQYLLYVVALHRWLGHILPNYDYERHIGEVYYLFVRGIAAGGGVFRDRPPLELIEALDATLGVSEVAA